MTIARGRVLSLLAGAVAAPAFARIANAQDAPVRVAYNTDDVFAEAVYADGGGFFKQAGLNVALVRLANSGAIASAVAGGSIDIGIGNLISLANAVQSGIAFAAIAPGSLYVDSKPTTVLVAAKTSPIQTPKDLEGKTVGLIEVRGITQTAMVTWLRKNSIEATAVKYVELPFSAMGPAVVQGRVDAVFIGEPFWTSIRPDTKVVGKPYGAIASEWYVNMFYSTKDWLAKNPLLARRFVDAMSKAAVWANAHPAETAAMLQKVNPLSDDVMAKMTRTQYAQKIDLTRIQPVLDAAAREGAIKRAIDAHEFVVLPA